MALVNGPLFSLEASGQLGKALVYTTWKGRALVRAYAVPTNPNSIAQRARRTWVALLNTIWQGMDDTDKGSWADLAAAGNYSTFNGFTSFNLDAQTADAGPTKNRGDSPSSPGFVDDGTTVTGGENKITIDWAIDATNADAYVVFSLAEGTSAPGATELAAVAYVPANNLAGTLEIKNLPAGTYSISWFAVTNDGTKSTVLASDTSIVVTGV